MLVLSRKPSETIRIGENITITVLRISGNSVRIGIDAPRETRVVRGELRPKDEVPVADEPQFNAECESLAAECESLAAAMDGGKIADASPIGAWERRPLSRIVAQVVSAHAV